MILVELWVDGAKRFSHAVNEESQIKGKVIMFREMAIKANLVNWRTYILRQAPSIKLGRLTKEQQHNWNQHFKIQFNYKRNK